MVLRGPGEAVTSWGLAELAVFSGARVSRISDRLEAKCIMARERHGMTNRARIIDGTTR